MVQDICHNYYETPGMLTRPEVYEAKAELTTVCIQAALTQEVAGWRPALKISVWTLSTHTLSTVCIVDTFLVEMENIMCLSKSFM